MPPLCGVNGRKYGEERRGETRAGEREDTENGKGGGDSLRYFVTYTLHLQLNTTFGTFKLR